MHLTLAGMRFHNDIVNVSVLMDVETNLGLCPLVSMQQCTQLPPHQSPPFLKRHTEYLSLLMSLPKWYFDVMGE